MALGAPSKENHDGGVHIYEWEQHGISITLEKIRESRRLFGAEGRLTALGINGTSSAEIIHSAHINLDSSSSREGTFRKLKRIYPDLSELWEPIVDWTCIQTIKSLEQEQVAVALGHDMKIRGGKWLVYPMIAQGQINIIYGDGDAGKSLFCLACQLALELGRADIVGVKPSRASTCMYLDWETDPDTNRERLLYLSNGLHLQEQTTMPYLRCYGAISNHVDHIRREAARYETDTFIIDSLSYACGGEINSDASVAMMQEAYGRIGGTWIVIAHVPAQTGTPQQQDKIRGIEMWKNWARVVWRMVREDSDNPDTMQWTFYNRKCNIGRPPPSQSFLATFNDEGHTLVIKRASAAQAESSTKYGNQLQRIESAFIQLTGLRDVEEIRLETGLTTEQVRKKLTRYRDKKFVSKDGKWGLAAQSW